jgi:hypothetical protein
VASSQLAIGLHCTYTFDVLVSIQKAQKWLAATAPVGAHRNALKIARFRCGYLSSFCGRWTTGAAARRTSLLVLKQSDDLLSWRPKSRRSQTPIAELGQSSMRSVPGYLCQVFLLPQCLFRLYKKCAAAAATDRLESSDGVKSQERGLGRGQNLEEQK